MKQPLILPCCIALVLALALAMPVSAESSTITSISPAAGYTGSTTAVTIAGTGFNESSVAVRLMMDDESNITAAVTSHTATEIVCKFTISSSKTTGDWDLVVINEDGSEVISYGGFAIRDPMTLTSISPESARTNNDCVDFTIEGSGLSDVSALYLYKSGYDNVTATIDDTDDDGITGTFDLTDTDILTYKVCVLDSYGTAECDLSFDVLSDAVGTLEVSSTPSGGSVYIDNDLIGTTPLSKDDLDIGSHKLIIKYSGYSDYTKLVKITEGDTTTIDATLAVITTVPTPTPTMAPATVPTTISVTRKATSAIATPWPTSTATPVQESPVDPVLIIAGIALGLCAIRKC
ncbi:MAG: PEGA domain-containing protein [Methanoregula sp.]